MMIKHLSDAAVPALTANDPTVSDAHAGDVADDGTSLPWPSPASGFADAAIDGSGYESQETIPVDDPPATAAAWAWLGALHDGVARTGTTVSNDYSTRVDNATIEPATIAGPLAQADDGRAQGDNPDWGAGDYATGLPAALSVAGTLSAVSLNTGSRAASVAGPALNATQLQVLKAIGAVGLPYNGSGITVGVLSDSFNHLGGAATDEQNGALPTASNVNILKDLTSGGTDEGRAMMQVVHDIATGAKLAFYTADVSETDFAAGIIALANAGCKVICDDVSYFDEPFFQTDAVANAIQTVEQQGVTFVSSAGNQGFAAYQAAWSPIASTTFDGQTLTDAQNFGTQANPNAIQTITNNFGAFENWILQWNQPYGQATTALGVLVFSNGSLVGKFSNANVAGFTQNNFGLGASSPVVTFSFEGTLQIAVEVLSGPNPGVIKDLIYNDSSPSFVSMSGANAGTVIGHHMSPYTITAGAVDALNTPGNGGTLQNEGFSSSGLQTQLWFNFNGSPVAGGPLNLKPVSLSGADDVNTTVPGGLADFFGTSCATPTIAAVCADLLQASPNLTPTDIKSILELSATSFGDPNVAGAGMLNAAVAVLDLKNRYDFTGDGNGDVPIQSANGVIDFANMFGGVFQNWAAVGDTPGWEVVGEGKITGNPSSDVVIQNHSTGQIAYANLVNGNFSNWVGVATTPSWNVVGVGDINHDGFADIVTQNMDPSSGQILYANMSGGSFQGWGTVGMTPGFNVVGVGDVNGDGFADIVVQNPFSGEIDYANMNGGVFTNWARVAITPGWNAVGVGDINRDGFADVVIQNQSTGQIAYANMNGGAFTSWVGVGTTPGFNVTSVEDVIGNGFADIVVQSLTTGEIDYANMTGGTFHGWGAVGITPGFTAHTGPATVGGETSISAADLGIPADSGSAVLMAATTLSQPQHLGALE